MQSCRLGSTSSPPRLAATRPRSAGASLSEPWDEVHRNAEFLRDLGIDYLVCSWLSEGRRQVEEFWTKIAPDLTG